MEYNETKIGRKTIIVMLLVVIMFAMTFVGCGTVDYITSLEQLNAEGYDIGVMTGAASMYAAEDYFTEANLVYHSTTTEGYESVATNKTDAVVFDEHILKSVVIDRGDLVILEDSSIGTVEIAVGISREIDNNDSLTILVNAFLADNQDVLDDMYSRWVDGTDYTMPEIEAVTSANADTLVVATEALNYPMSYIGDGAEVTGYDIELAKRIALYANMKLVISDNNWVGCQALMETGGADLFISSVNKSESNAAYMDFSDVYLTSNICLAINADRAEVEDVRTPAYTIDDLANSKLGAVTGSTYETITADYIENPTIVQANSFSDLVTMVVAGKIKGYLMDEPIARMHCAANESITYIEIPDTEQEFAFAYSKDNTENYIDELNVYIASIVYDTEARAALEEKWFTTDETYKTVIDYDSLPATNGTIRVGATDTVVPFTYSKDGQVVGYDIDIIANFCYENGYALELEAVSDLSSLLAGIGTKYDLVLGGLTVTDERKETMNFLSVPTYTGGIVAVVPCVSPMYSEFSELEGKDIGVFSGSISYWFLDQKIEDYTEVEYFSESDMIVAIKSADRKIDAFMVDTPIGQSIVAGDNSLAIFPQEFDSDDYCFAFQNDSAYRNDFNDFLADISASGDLDDIIDRWTDDDESNNVIPSEYYLTADETSRTFSIAVADTKEPMSYIDTTTGLAIGMEVEILYYYAYLRGMYVDCTTGTFAGILAGVQEGKYDVAAGTISLTEEREESMDLSDSYYSSSPILIVLNTLYVEENGFVEFFSDLYDSFIRTFVTESRWLLILQGVGTTILITVASAFFGTILGAVVCVGKRSRLKVLNNISNIFIKIMQGTPIVVMLMILYYIVFGSWSISAVVVSIIGFSMNFAAYTSEMMNAGLESLDKNQLEAARALGFGKFKAFFYVTLPQAARIILPVYRGEFISMLKMTSVVGYISVQDLTKMSDIIRSRTYEAFFPLISTAIIYFGIAAALVFALRFIERRLEKKPNKMIKGVIKHD